MAEVTVTRRRRSMSWPVAAGLTLAQAVALFAGARLAATLVRQLAVQPLRAALLNAALVALLTLTLGVVGGALFRSRRLVAVWAATLVLFTVADVARTVYDLITDEQLSYQPRSQMLAQLVPGLLAGSLLYLVMLGAVAAAGVGIGVLLTRSRR